MTIPTGIPTGVWLVILTLIIIIYSVYFFGDSGITHRTVRDRLRTIILPSMDFQANSLADAAGQLTNLADTHDTLGDGVQFTVIAAPDSEDTHQPVLIRLHKTDLWEALEQVALLYQVNYHIDSSACAVIFNAHHPSPCLIRRDYILPVERFPLSWACRDYLAYFRGFGLPFPTVDGEESHIDYNDSTRVLSVYTVENTLNLMEKMFDLDPDRMSEN